MKKRIEWIDTLRGLAMFFVILGHAFINRKNIVRNYIYSFHMPLFFFISGLTTKRSNMKFFEFLKKKIKAILLPYIFINIFILLFKLVMNISLGMYSTLDIKVGIEYFIKGYSNYLPCIQSWFLLALFIMDVIFFLLTKITKNDIQLTIMVILIFILGYMYTKSDYTFLVYWHIDTALIGLVFYHAGYLFMKFIDKIGKVLESYKSIFLILITFPLGYYIQYINGRVSMNANNYKNVNYYLISSFLTIFSLIIFVNLFLKKDKLFKKVGIISIFYLGYHGCLLTPIKEFLEVLLSNNMLTILTSLLIYVALYPIAIVCLKYAPILVGKFKEKKT